MHKKRHLLIPCAFIVSMFVSSASLSMESGSGMYVLPGQLSEMVQKQIEQQLNPIMASLGHISRNLSQQTRRSLFQRAVRMGKIGVGIAVVGGVVYGGYKAYKSFGWLRSCVGKVVNKAKAVSQNWLDINWIKEKLTGITTKINELSGKIANLVTGQDKLKNELASVAKNTQQIIKNANGNASETKAKLDAMDKKLDEIKAAITNQS